jgi:hypothetical protein
MNYETIFEQTKHGNLFLSFIPLLGFALIGIGIIYSEKKYYKTFSAVRQGLLFFGYLFGGFAIILLIISLIKTPSLIRENRDFNKMIENKSYKVVEGLIEDFSPPNSNGTHFESFSVNGIIFKYSDYSIVDGFHQTSKNNGPINKNGQQVRIGYTNKDDENLILKLEILK